MEQSEGLISKWAEPKIITINTDLENIKMELKECQHQLAELSKENRHQRLTVFYQPTDYYVYAPPDIDPS